MKNVGKKDKIIRYILAVVLVAVGIIMGPTNGISILLFVIAGASAITGMVGFCGAYKIFGIDTCKFDKGDTH